MIRTKNWATGCASYQETHPQGDSLDFTVSEQTVHIGPHRRHVDRAIWAGLGRLPQKDETPAITVEFVSEGRRSRQRDYQIKRDEYRSAGVREYWIIDRFARLLTVYRFARENHGESHPGAADLYDAAVARLRASAEILAGLDGSLERLSEGEALAARELRGCASASSRLDLGGSGVNSLRSTARIVGSDKKSIGKLIVAIGRCCRNFLDEKLRGLNLHTSRVRRDVDVRGEETKARLTTEEKRTETGTTGDMYLWTAIETKRSC